MIFLKQGLTTFGIKGDTLYAAYYQGGLRIVDILASLWVTYTEKAEKSLFFKQVPKKGHIPNAPNVWGTIPYKGLIFFTDMYSGFIGSLIRKR
ncbi:MAG: hypothetical protein Ct9H300mP29_4920 [Candidatus Neomarinimicrobiota bacterium]|nr:MAG: hypothetical protein Ct9H300mP29_4920 [Candidatus Neomarinimicrobiota bacterium]